MENLIILVHILTALAIIGLILLQQGKGADMGASFGSGASQTLFGASGSGNFFSKMTAILAFVFFVTSFSLAVIAKQKASIGDDLPAVIETTVDDVPAVEDTSIPVDDDIPQVETETNENSQEDIPEVPEQ
ncbi:preprotein translocase subunit SecG [Agarilytica rhodophyticola]|uniref:preprotein translocase subunit SecG n=1 Tax=Agarilytica rhodophyticola TaxID=1737490 RepID=UPI000B34131E|nr:preprotein translocase subunit SecG [Agarilytica rhodophyticola]